jgi:DNA-binding transcriptional ArsR family regulator
MDVFEAIAEPHRRRMLDLLADGDLAAGELVAALPRLSQPAVSRHLKVLREAGLVEVRIDAQRRIYTLRPQAFGEVDEWLERYRRYFSEHLDALEQHLSDKHRNAKPQPRKGTKSTRKGNRT